MVQRSPALDELRSYILQTGSAFLRNVRWIPGITCRTCGGIPGQQGYDQCYPCYQMAGNLGLVDRLGMVTYAWSGGQAARTMHAYKAAGATSHTMHAYKAAGATSHQLVYSLLAYAVVAHWPCITQYTGSPPDGWAYVPSLAGREGAHPLAQIATGFMGAVPNVTVTAQPLHDDPRSFNPDHFTAGPTTARHVLLLDDTWTTGGHLQSVAAALKMAGVQQVTALVVARWLDPKWGSTKSFIEGLTNDFDPAICPYTGGPC